MPEDLDRLQGEWSVSTLEVDEQKMARAMLAGARIVVQGDRFTSSGMGVVYEGTLHLDASAKPRRLDMRFDCGPEKGNTNLCIYELRRDSWKLCIATRGDVRPRRFAAPVGSGHALEVLTRGASGQAATVTAPETAAANAGAGATELEGEWTMVSAVMDGKPMDASLVQWVRRVTQGSRTSVYAGPQTMLKADFTHDPSHAPKTIEYVLLAGPQKGKTQLGIYALVGARLSVCMAAVGKPRPKEFGSSPGDGATFTVWERK